MNSPSLPVLVAAALLTVSACGGDDSAESEAAAQETPADTSTTDGSGEQPADSPTVTLADSAFDQSELTVPVGTTVMFVNTDPFDHTVTSDDGSPVAFDSGEFGEDQTFEFTFDEPGEYPYFCQIHPTMQAMIVVE